MIDRPYATGPRDARKGERVLVAMSGGVDSSVAAAMLVQQGYDAIGVTMKLFCYGDEVPDRPCCSLDSITDAARVCDRLGIPHYVLNLEPTFGHDVVADFVDEYARGRTPIPCVRCNTFTKFRDLVKKADSIDAHWIATGHYARVIDGQLYRGVDPAKDQSYFLWGIRRPVLQRAIFPVGHLDKPATRAAARELGLITADKVESQDICFVPDGDHANVIASRLGADSPPLQRGPVVLSDGRVVGEHAGYARFTIGQRKGLPGGFTDPMFVTEIRAATREVVIGPRAELLGRGVIAREVNWLGQPATIGDRLSLQVRHRARPALAEVVRIEGDEIELALEDPVAAIAPGQSLVLYDDERVVGGGVIERAAAGFRQPLPLR